MEVVIGMCFTCGDACVGAVVCCVNARCVDLTNTYLGDLVSKYFVEIAFGGDSLTEATHMADSIIASFMANLQTLGV